METLTNNDAIMIMLKKYLFINYFVSYERFFIRRKITTVLGKLPLQGLSPRRLLPTINLKHPLILTQGEIFLGQSSGGNFASHR